VRSSPDLVMISSWKGFTSRPVEGVAEGREHLVHVALLDDPVEVHPLSSWRR
jgi:hypothetical protein